MEKRPAYSINKQLLGLISLAVLVFIVHFFSASSVLAKDSTTTTRFLILVSKKTPPYLKCEKGVKEVFWKKYKGTFETKSLYLSKEQPGDLKQKIEEFAPSVAVCIGTRAAFFLKDEEFKFPWVATFLIDKSIESLMAPGLLAVSMDVPIERRIETLCRIKNRVRAGLLTYKSPKSSPKRIQTGACKGKDAYYIMSPFFSSIESALQTLLEEQVDSFFITPDPVIFNSQEAVAYALLWGLRNKVAVCGLSSGYVKNGALYALEADIEALGKQAGRLAIARIEGRTSGKTVIEHPQKLILSINLKTAKRLGLKIPPDVLNSAQMIIR